MNLVLDHHFHGDLAIVTVSGDIDVFTSPQLRDQLQELITDTGVHLVVDLNGVEFLDSAGLGVLVAVYHRLRSRGGSMVFVGANERVRRVFHITQLSRIFPLHMTLDEALDASDGYPDAAN